MLRDNGKRLGLHPRGQAWKREDGGMMGGRRDEGKTARQWEIVDNGGQQITGDSG